MSEFTHVSRNSVYSFFSIFFRLFANVILFWLIARFYGKEIFGQFTIAQTFASIFVIFADFGLDVLLTTELPRNIINASDLFKKLFTIKLILSGLAFIGMILVAYISNFSSNVRLLIIIFSFYAFFTTITNFLFALFRGTEKLKYETKVSFIVNFGSLLVILVLLLLKENIIVISIAFAITRLVGILITVFYAYEVLPSISFNVDFRGIKAVLNQVIIFGMFLVFGNLFFQLDTVLLAFFKGEKNVGLYQAVFRLVLLPLIVPEVFINSMMPTLSRFHSEDKEKWIRLGSFMNKFLIIMAIPLSIGCYFFSEQIIELVYGKKEYLEAIPILKIFSIIILVRFMAEPYGLMLTTSKNQRTRMFIVLVATFLNVVLNLFIIPRFSIAGAAIVSLFTNVFVGFFYFYFAKKMLSGWYKKLFTKKLLWLIIMFLIIMWLLSNSIIWFVSIFIIGLYFIYVYKNILSDSERKYFSEIKIFRFGSSSK